MPLVTCPNVRSAKFVVHQCMLGDSYTCIVDRYESREAVIKTMAAFTKRCSHIHNSSVIAGVTYRGEIGGDRKGKKVPGNYPKGMI